MSLTTATPNHRARRGEMRSALTTLAELHEASIDGPFDAACATGFSPLDEVLSGGVGPGEVLLVGGKPGVGKTIACLQWARSMARQGIVAVYLCYEHDPVTLLARLLACELGEVAHAAGRHLDLGIEELQGRLRDVAAGVLTLREALDSDPMLEEAERRFVAYADRLVLFQGSGTRTNVPSIGDALSPYTGQPIVLFVDYVQKVPVVPDVALESERVSRVIESLKELALEQNIGVVAVAAAGHEGLSARRLHLHHFRGSTALAYEADAVVVLNEKLAVVSRAHAAYAPTRIEEFRGQVVFSVEKNRNGVAGVDLEFAKHFHHYRFDPKGTWVADRLWTEGSIET
jgi:hypothetical protein